MADDRGAGAAPDLASQIPELKTILDKRPGEFSKGISRGVAGLKESVARAGEGAATALDLPGLKAVLGSLAESAKRQGEAPELAPAVRNIDEARTLGDIGSFAAASLGENIPNVGATAASAIVASRLPFLRNFASRALPGVNSTVAAGTAGAAASSGVQNFGEIYGEMRDNGVDAPGLAAAYAAPAALLDSVGPGLLLGAVTKVPRDIAKRGLASAVARVLGGAGIGAATEGVTETAQETLAVLARDTYQPGYADSDEVGSRLRNAAAGGILVGGAFGGVGGAARALRSPAPEQATPAAEVEPAAPPGPLESAVSAFAGPAGAGPVDFEMTSAERRALEEAKGVDLDVGNALGYAPNSRFFDVGTAGQAERVGFDVGTPAETPVSFDVGTPLVERLDRNVGEARPRSRVDLDVGEAAPTENVGFDVGGPRLALPAPGATSRPLTSAATAAAARADAGLIGAARAGNFVSDLGPAPDTDAVERLRGSVLPALAAAESRAAFGAEFGRRRSNASEAQTALAAAGVPVPRRFASADVTAPRVSAEESPVEYTRSRVAAAVDEAAAEFGDAADPVKIRRARSEAEAAVKAALAANTRADEIEDAVRAAVLPAARRAVGDTYADQFAAAIAARATQDIPRAASAPRGRVRPADLADARGNVAVALEATHKALPQAERDLPNQIEFTAGRAVRGPVSGAATIARVPADKIYDATDFATDPLFTSAPGSPAQKAAQYLATVRDRGFSAALLPGGEIRVLKPTVTVSVEKRAPERLAASASKSLGRYGYAAASLPGVDYAASLKYAVGSYGRDARYAAAPDERALRDYTRANVDVLSDPDAALVARFDARTGETVVSSSALFDRLTDALAAARKAGLPGVVDLRTGVFVPAAHPVFDAAQAYNEAAGHPPVQPVDYAQVDPRAMEKIARAYDRLQVSNPDPGARASYSALAAETEAQYEIASKYVRIEPWTRVGQPYASSAETRADVFARGHLYVLAGGEPHPFFTPEQNYKFRAVRDLFGHAKTGFEFGARGELNATRAHAQMYSRTALPALVTETIGQNSWVNFGPANAGKAPDERAFAPQKADLLAEELWAPLLQSGLDLYSRAMYTREAVLTAKGTDAIALVEKLLGRPENLALYTFVAGEGGRNYVGRYSKRGTKDVIELALNSVNPQSVAAHEAFHYLEENVLAASERSVVNRAFRSGDVHFARLVRAAKAYDTENGTDLTAEVLANQREAAAYGFQFWREGKLEADTVVGRVFDKLRALLERVANAIRGLGFVSIDDVFEAVNRGDYAARRAAEAKVLGTPENDWLADVEPDVLPGAALAYNHQGDPRTPASAAKGRPYWVKSAGDVLRMRNRIKKLALEGAAGRDWHYRSADAILSWANGDRQLAETMAKLIANYSPRTPVGQDLVKALITVAQFRAGAEISPGAPKAHIEGAKRILAGGDVTGEKRGNFFRNLMTRIDPNRYGPDRQGATIDMWMSHAFEFGNDTAGSVTPSQYNYANAEVQRLGRDLGWTVEETQAAVWIAVKGRGNATRSAALDYAVKQNWVDREAVPLSQKEREAVDRQGVLFGNVDTKFKYALKPERERDFVSAWMRIARDVPFTREMFENGNYSYAEAFRDIASGKLKASRANIVVEPTASEADLSARLDDQTADVLRDPPELELFSKAAYIEVDRAIASGNFSRAETMRRLSDALKATGVADGQIAAALSRLANEPAGAAETVRNVVSGFASGRELARRSAGYANVFDALTTLEQRKKRLISDSTERALAKWRDAKQGQVDRVSKALLERTMGGFETGSADYARIVGSLSDFERGMFDDATRMIAATLDAEFAADKLSHARVLGEESKEYKDWATSRAAQVEELKRTGYFPERRYGDHAVNVFVRDPSGKKVTLLFEQYESKAAAQSRIAGTKNIPGLKSLLADNPTLEVEYAFKYNPEFDGGLSFQKFIELAEGQGIKFEQHERERLAKALISADSTRNNRIFRRENVPGASENGTRVLSEFAVTTANKIAYAELSPAIRAAQKGRAASTRFNTDGTVSVDINEKSDLWADGGELAGYYRRESDRLVKFVLDSRPSELAGKLRTLASLEFLGGSVAAAGVQLTSLYMNAAPFLSQYSNAADAMSKITSAAGLAFRHLGVVRDLARLNDRSIRLDGVDNISGLRDALVVAAQDGTILDTEIYEIMGMSRGKVFAQSALVRKAADAWMAPFRYAEQVNRVATFVAAYRIGLERKMGGPELYSFAQKAVYDTQFRYDDANKPRFARGAVGSLLLTFKTYPIFTMELLLNLAKTDKAAAAFMLGMVFMMSGLEGLPFADDLLDIVDTVSQRVFGSPFSARRWAKNALSSASEFLVGADMSSLLMQGTANYLTGANFASRVGLGNMVPGTRLATADADFKKVALEIAGPAAAAVFNTANFFGEVSRGDLEGALRASPATAITNAAKGYYAWQRGYFEDRAGQRLAQASGPEAILQGLGMSPASVARLYDLDRIDKETAAFYRQEQKSLVKQMVKGFRDSDPVAIAEARAVMDKWNERNPEMPMRVDAASLRRQIAESGLVLNERTLRHLPRALRAQSVAAEEGGR